MMNKTYIQIRTHIAELQKEKEKTKDRKQYIMTWDNNAENKHKYFTKWGHNIQKLRARIFVKQSQYTQVHSENIL